MLRQIQELMDLKGWSRARLAAELDLSQNAIERWFIGDRVPGGPASVLMGIWLTAARKKAKKTVEA